MAARVLVTGGAGYIGSHVCKSLARAGHSPVTFDNLCRGHRDAVKWGPIEVSDLADRTEISRVLRAHRIEAVIHLAAYAYVGESVENPALYYRNNVINAINLLESMVECDIPNIVFSSTCAVYGPPQHTPITESHPTHPVNPYGESKLFIEKTLASFASAYDLRPMSLRYFNAAGADVDGELGENHEPETHLIPLAIDSARLPERQLTIFGDDYQTKDGSAVRDYIHVTDLADAHVRALDHLTNGGAPHTLNLGTGQGYSVLEVIKAVENSTGARVNHRFGPRRDGDVSALIADARKSLQVLGWTPKYSSLEEIVRSAAAWRIKGSGAAADRTEVIEQVASSAVFAAS